MKIKEGYIICGNRRKESILTNLEGFKNYIFLSEAELIKKIYGSVKPSAAFELMKEYQLSYELALEYIKYIPYVNKNCYNNLKLDSIVSARKHLEQEGYYKYDKLFNIRLSQYPVTILDFYNKKILANIKKYLSKYTEVIELQQEKKEYNPTVYSFKDSYNEALYVMNSISNLYKNGVSLNNIYILNMNEEYQFIFKRLSKSYNIPILFSPEKNILSFDIAKKFLALCEELDSFDEIINKLDNTSEYYMSIVNMLINYELQKENPKDYLEFFKKVLAEISISQPKYEEMVRVLDFDEFNDNDYVFYLNCNLGVTPKVYKDEEYLNDYELELLNIPTSVEKNKESKNNIIRLFKYTKNLVITLREIGGKGSCLPANVLNEIGAEIKYTGVDFGYSKIEDTIRFGVAQSKYSKYGVRGDELDYYTDYLRYNEYDNKFSGISNELMSKVFEAKPLQLAYSNLKTYYACPFAYYLDKILDINEFESSSSTRLGQFAHSVLEASYLPDFDFNTVVTASMIEHADDKEEYKDYFYFNQMKEILSCLIAYNKKHEELSKLDIIEREFFMKYEEDNYSFIGFVDKLMYTEINNEIYAAIIDYKTGKDYISLDNIEDGFNLQLPCYMFLLTNYEKFKGKKIHIIGIYLQKVNIIALDNTIDIISQREKSFRLRGYSTTNLGALALFDPNYSFSDYIQSMSCKKDGSFGAYAKVINESDEKRIIELTKELIYKASVNIHNGKFDIEPKRIDGEDKSCTYCKYKDICFMKYENGIDLMKKPFFEKEEK